jgi:hypothetical protein
MLAPEKQASVRKILENARKALSSGSVAECTQALERIAEVGQVLSEVILYDPSSFASSSAEAAEDGAEEA